MSDLVSVAPRAPGLEGRAEELRRAGHRLVDRMADHLAGLEARPVSTPLGAAAIAARFAEPLPWQGRAEEEVWEETWDRVVGDSIQLSHGKLSLWGSEGEG
jgi:hypothetical protein